MKKQTMDSLLMACLVLFLAASSAFGLDIVKDGKPVARIVMPDNADSFTTQAAGWIQKYVKTCTGAELVILSESKAQEPGPRICVGATKAAAEAGIRIGPEQYGGSRLIVKGDRLFLLGHDEQPLPNDRKYPNGTGKAAVTFLEDFCGVRWLIPTPLGEVVPQRKDISVPSDLDRTIVPLFLYACPGKAYGINTPASFANNWRESIRLYTAGGHIWNEWVPVAKYYKDHPEYFALVNGRRTDSKDNHLCTSNPDVKRLLLEGLRQKFDKGYDWVESCQSDGFKRCECPACEAMDNYRGESGFETNRCERVLMLQRYLAEECLKSHPDKKVLIMSYGPATWPSKKFDKFPDNVVLEIDKILQSRFDVWQGKVKAFSSCVYWWTFVNTTWIGPQRTANQVAESLRFMRANHINGIYFCGLGNKWGLEGHTYYACGKLMGNPDLNPKELVKEYCNGLFGKAAPVMLKFFEALDDRARLVQGKAITMWSEGLFQQRNAEPVYIVLYPPETLNRLESLLCLAEMQADDERSRMWVGLTRYNFDILKLTVNAFTLYRAFRMNPNRANLSQLQKVVEEWRAQRDKILNLPEPEVARWFPGHHDWKVFFAPGGGYMRTLTVPFYLDFAKMTAEYAADTPPGPAKLAVARVTKAPTIDGVIGEDEWKATAPVDLKSMTGGPVSVPTKVRMAFDDKNIYVAFICSEPNIDNLRLNVKDYKRDEQTWTLDCAEIFFDPEAGGTKFMQFIATPSKDCFFDARTGYIEDILDPLFGKDDRSWNPDWKYAFKVDAGKKEWTIEAEIPFTSLDVTPPGLGTHWKGNFGRERYAGNPGKVRSKKEESEAFLWSPNKLNDSFGEPLVFGDLYFEKAPADVK